MEHVTNIVLTASIVKESNNKMSTPTEMHIDALMEKIEKLEAENDRYRKALELILESELLRHSPFVGYSEAIANAREALKGE